MKTTLKFWAYRILEDCPHFGISQLLERAPQKIIEALGPLESIQTLEAAKSTFNESQGYQ